MNLPIHLLHTFFLDYKTPANPTPTIDVPARCMDSKRRFKVVKNGNEMTTDCEWVATRQNIRCGYEGAPEACRKTCGLCEEEEEELEEVKLEEEEEDEIEDEEEELEVEVEEEEEEESEEENKYWMRCLRCLFVCC